MDPDVEEIGPWVVAALRQDVACPCIHAEVLSLLFVWSSAQVGDVPHSDCRHECHTTVDEPIVWDIPRGWAIPEIDCEASGDARKDGVGQRGEPDFATSHDGLDLRAVNEARDVDKVMRDDDGELQDDKQGK